MRTNVTTRSVFAAAASLTIGATLAACAGVPATRESVAADFAAAYISGDNDRAVALVCEGILSFSDPLRDSWAVSSAAPPANWDFAGLVYSVGETTADGVVLGRLGKDVQFDVTTARAGDGFCVKYLSLNGASGHVKR